MPTLSETVRLVQNPALGAVLEWRFVIGYTAQRSDGAECPIVLLFIVLPMLFQEEIVSTISKTRRSSGLRVCAEKFSRGGAESDLILGLHERVEQARGLSLAALQIAVASRLVAIHAASGDVFPLSKTLPKARVSAAVKPMVESAEKLGRWCADLTLLEVATTLKLRF